MVPAALAACKRYLEYGSGDTTVLAAKLSCDIVGVDNGRIFLEAVRRKIGNRPVTLIPVNTGIIGPWGMPLPMRQTRGRRTRWRRYVEAPWKLGIAPDLVLVDGRFRVACAAEALLRSSARVLVDDYPMRPHYHVLESVADVSLHGRIADLQRKRDASDDALRGVLEQHRFDYR